MNFVYECSALVIPGSCMILIEITVEKLIHHNYKVYRRLHRMHMEYFFLFFCSPGVSTFGRQTVLCYGDDCS